VPEEIVNVLAFLPAALAEEYHEGPFAAIVRTREEFSRWLGDPRPGAETLQLEGLIGDSEVWALAAQGTVPIPLDVVLEHPASEFSALYRLADVRLAREVRVTIPARPGLMKALRLAAALQLSVRLLPGQPDSAALAELAEAAEFYLRDAMVEAPVEFFHSVLSTLRGLGEGTLWQFLEQDPAIYSHRDPAGRPQFEHDFVASHLTHLLQEGAECVSCPWQKICAGYFKWPEPVYDCAGIKRLFALLQCAAAEMTRDLTEWSRERAAPT
jgi:hypothetical protein